MRRLSTWIWLLCTASMLASGAAQAEDCPFALAVAADEALQPGLLSALEARSVAAEAAGESACAALTVVVRARDGELELELPGAAPQRFVRTEAAAAWLASRLRADELTAQRIDPAGEPPTLVPLLIASTALGARGRASTAEAAPALDEGVAAEPDESVASEPNEGVGLWLGVSAEAVYETPGIGLGGQLEACVTGSWWCAGGKLRFVAAASGRRNSGARETSREELDVLAIFGLRFFLGEVELRPTLAGGVAILRHEVSTDDGVELVDSYAGRAELGARANIPLFEGLGLVVGFDGGLSFGADSGSGSSALLLQDEPRGYVRAHLGVSYATW